MPGATSLENIEKSARLAKDAFDLVIRSLDDRVTAFSNIV
jgi:hypothetical protein